MRILIKNAMVMDQHGSDQGDLLIDGEKIVERAAQIKTEADRVIDAQGALVLPGAIDVHTHMELDLGQYVSVDDFYTGTVAAAYGGTTTICDHIAFGKRGDSLRSILEHYHELGEKAVGDYAFHGVIQDVDQDHLQELGPLFNEGVVSLKLYTTYGGKLNDEEILQVLETAKKTGTIVCVHCENDGAITQLRKEAQQAGHLDPIYHAKTRPAETEAEAIERLCYLSTIAGFPKLYIVHTSSRAGVEAIRAARARGVKNLYCETCPQYLLLTEEKYCEGGNAEGVKYIMAPPLREEKDQTALWEAVKDGTVDVIATDHCPFFYERDKKPHKDHFLTAPGGAPGVEERMELMLTEAQKRGVSLAHMVELLITNPAKIMGFYPQKGHLGVGADADVVIYRQKPKTITQGNRHSACDYTGYEGFRVDYAVETVIRRGEIVIEAGCLKAEKGSGRFIKRHLE